LVKVYNTLCVDIQKLIHRGQAPQGAIAPVIIDREGLFKLDVDDEIWQDTGLDEFAQDGVPLWLGNDSVKAGIKALLLYDRCCEEENRILKERCALQEWMLEEWKCTQWGIEACGMFIS